VLFASQLLVHAGIAQHSAAGGLLKALPCYYSLVSILCHIVTCLAGDVYTSVTEFLQFHPKFDVMREQLEKSGVIRNLTLANTVATVFAPTGIGSHLGWQCLALTAGMLHVRRNSIPADELMQTAPPACWQSWPCMQ
jgi:hypothetical protein